MQTLKKVMALTLVFALAFTLVAGATSFTDDKTIKDDYKDAVEILNALNVIKGFTDNTFRPDQIVTRAEMAKMIYVIMNNGSEDNSSIYVNSVDHKFGDIKGHWAEGFILYGYANGIIAGRSATKYEPDAPVNALEAAKMVLTILGYDQVKAGLVGNSWAVNTTSLGTHKKLFDKYSYALRDGAPRQGAAQILYNGLMANKVKLVEGVYVDVETALGVKTTLGADRLGLMTMDVQVLGDNKFSIGASTAAKDMTRVSDLETSTERDIKFVVDSALIGREAKVVYKETNPGNVLGVPATLDSKDTIYSVYPLSTNNVITTTKKDIQTSTATVLKVNDKEYNVTTGAAINTAGATKLYNNYVNSNLLYVGSPALASYTGLKDDNTPDLVKIILDGDNVKAIIMETTKISKVTAVASGKATLSGVGQVTLADITAYDGIAKDDIVYVTYKYGSAQGDVTKVAKATVMTGKVTGKDADGGVVVGGKSYGVSTADIATGLVFATSCDVSTEYKFYMFGEKFFFADPIDELKLDKFAVITGSKMQDFDPAKLDQVQIFTSAGKTETYKVTDSAFAHVAGTLIKYSINTKGEIKYEVAPAANSAAMTYTKSTKVASFATLPAATTGYFSNNAPIFWKDASNSWKVYNASNLNDNVTALLSGTCSFIKDGTTTVFINAMIYGGAAKPPVSVSDATTLYGYIVDVPTSSTNANDDPIIQYKIQTQNGTANYTLEVSDVDYSVAGTAKKGDYVVFEADANNLIGASPDGFTTKGLLKAAGGFVKAAIVAYDAPTGVITFKSGMAAVAASYLINSDTKTVYIDASDKKGASSSGYQLADDVNHYYNCYYTLDGGAVKAIFVDITSNIDGASAAQWS